MKTQKIVISAQRNRAHSDQTILRAAFCDGVYCLSSARQSTPVMCGFRERGAGALWSPLGIAADAFAVQGT